MPSSIRELIEHFDRLAGQGTLGYFNCVEVHEIAAFKEDGPAAPLNVLSIAVLDERSGPPVESPHFLNPERIRIRALPGWYFGIFRYLVSLNDLRRAMTDFSEGKEWRLSGDELAIGELVPVRPQFVPPDATQSAALNRILKNNFWNGSYVMELFDQSKKQLSMLQSNPPALQSFSAEVQKWVPIALASLADRLGNIVIQIPVKIVAIDFGFPDTSGMDVKLAWDSRSPARQCRSFILAEHDGSILGFGSARIDADKQVVETGDSSELNRAFVYDEERNLILAASGPVVACRSIHMSMAMIQPEPRLVVIQEQNGSLTRHRIELSGLGMGSVVGSRDTFEYRSHSRLRIYEEELAHAEETREFVQYSRGGERQEDKGLSDIVFLINKHGSQGVWLWDPFLDFRDVMRTLFLCRFSGVELRALGSFERRTRRHERESSQETPTLRDIVRRFIGDLRRWFKERRGDEDQLFEKWRDEQIAGFSVSGNNHEGLSLEFRARKGSGGWSFHDRFLIFPRSEPRPRAWSLGTSINSLGARHHIMQEVKNGQMIADAFEELWAKLEAPEFVVWKTP